MKADILFIRLVLLDFILSNILSRSRMYEYNGDKKQAHQAPGAATKKTKVFHN
jgi:hypothetical protein